MFVLAKAHPFFHQSAPHTPNTPHSTYMLLIYSLLCLFPTQASFSVIDHCLLRSIYVRESLRQESRQLQGGRFTVENNLTYLTFSHVSSGGLQATEELW